MRKTEELQQGWDAWADSRDEWTRRIIECLVEQEQRIEALENTLRSNGIYS